VSEEGYDTINKVHLFLDWIKIVQIAQMEMEISKIKTENVMLLAVIYSIKKRAFGVAKIILQSCSLLRLIETRITGLQIQIKNKIASRVN
jgi:hypothetical protein